MQNKPLPLVNEFDLLTVQPVHSNWTRLCISLINLNCSLVYFKAMDKKANIIPCLSDCLAPTSGWLVFFSKVQLRFISYLNVYCRLLNNWFSGSRSCTESDAKYQVQNQISVRVFQYLNESRGGKKTENYKQKYISVDPWCTLEAVFLLLFNELSWDATKIFIKEDKVTALKLILLCTLRENSKLTKI